MQVEITNPATGESVAHYDFLDQDVALNRVACANKAYQHWKKSSFDDRSRLMHTLAELLENKKQAYAELITTEMGKPITAAVAEIEKCALLCRYYADNAQEFLTAKFIETDAKESYVCYRPIGCVLAIMPWNYPFWQVFRFACPLLMAGNVALLKHAPSVSGCALAIEQLFLDVGFPQHCFTSLIIDNEVTSSVIAAREVKAVTLTGSERAGRIVGALAGASLKKVVLELGGSDPYVVLDDACLTTAAQQIVLSRMNNAGQVCIAAKRVIASTTIMRDLQKKVMALLLDYQCDDPQLVSCKLGPLARADLRVTLAQQVKTSIELGAKCLLGGEVTPGAGFYYPATVLTEVKPGMPAYDEELFGPVVSFIEAEDEADAIRLANDSDYGLAAAVFTSDLKRGKYIAEHKIEAGNCFVNGLVTSDPRLPFGGINQSGYGRELSAEGIQEFVNIKTVVIKA